MIIRKLSTEKFAGLSDKTVQFNDGLNVILGENESGKTTIINAVYHTLTGPDSISIKESKRGAVTDFYNECFPTGSGNFINATVDFTENSQPYKISREWEDKGKKCETKIVLSDNTRIKGLEAEQKLREILNHPTAIYNNLIFARQNHSKEILDWCTAFFSADLNTVGVNTARDMVSQALSAATGISMDKLTQTLDAKILECSQKWDFNTNGPEGGKEHKKECGTILKSYYNFVKKKAELEERITLDKKIEEEETKLKACDATNKALNQKMVELESKHQKIKEADSNKKLCDSEKSRRDDAVAAKNNKINADSTLDATVRLIELKKEFDNRQRRKELSKELEEISALNADIEKLEKLIEGLESIQTDCKQADNLSRNIEGIKNQLGAGELHADIKMIAPHVVQLESADGSVCEYTDSSVDIKGFFRINIPNVGEITIAPKNVDVKKLQEDIAEKEKSKQEILTRYSVDSLDALSQKAAEYSKNSSQLEIKRAARQNHKYTAEQLSTEIAQITIDENIDIPEDLTRQINNFLSEYRYASLEECKSSCDTIISSFNQKYKSLENAQAIIDDANSRIKEYESTAASDMSLEDYNLQVQKLDAENKVNHAARDTINLELGKLTNQADESSDVSTLEDECSKLETEWKHQIHLCESYIQIRKDLQDLLSANTGNKFEEFDKKFSEYISIITDGKITAQSASENTLSLKSGNNTINRAELLSAGTQDTLLLAFRLAVLNFFFPNGGGLIVIDDLVDMDAARRTNSAKLLNEFAKNNQVILMTCDENIADLVGGNRIVINK